MQGEVLIINKQLGKAAVQTEKGNFTIFGLSKGNEVELGDIINGDLSSMKAKKYTNTTKGKQIVLRVEKTKCDVEEAKKLVQA